MAGSDYNGGIARDWSEFADIVSLYLTDFLPENFLKKKIPLSQ
ncbi:hypothetical protein V0288_05810 [Pannus brasiliensis CCIBt3594]|uniref:Uncharacterized protein n=1 Tax=Pannus brasiliensis CCIBt3594 TaxID=1427578 RepID=A0AAW9QUQ8_9CHRO